MRGARRLAPAFPRHEAAGLRQSGVAKRIGDRRMGRPFRVSRLRELAYPSPGVTENEDSR